MEKIRCIIVDDEPLALDLVEGYIAQTNSLVLVEKFREPIAALEFIQQNDVDLAFLDIQMPQLTGLELASVLKSPNSPQIVFTTAYREFGAESYEYKAVDYLVKPFSFARFLESVDKVVQNLRASSKQIPIDYIDIKSQGKNFRVLFDDILFIESFKDFIKVNTSEKNLTSYQNITHFNDCLPQESFLRIHRSFIVNIKKIDAYNATHVQIGDEELPIGRSFKELAASRLTNS